MPHEKEQLLVDLMSQGIKDGFLSKKEDGNFSMDKKWGDIFYEIVNGYKIKNIVNSTPLHKKAYNSTGKAALKNLWDTASQQG